MSNVLSYSWALPSLSIIAATTFVTVHVSSGNWREPPILSNGGAYGTGIGTGKEVAGGGNINDEGVRPFTYVPTATPNEIDVLIPVPTSIVLGHNIPPGDGVGGFVSDLTWNIPFGEPTPDPALLYDPATPPAFINKGDGGGGQLGYPSGYPTSDHAQINGLSLPPGEATPDPALLNHEWTAPNTRPIEIRTISPSKPGDTLAPSSAKPTRMPIPQPTSQPTEAPVNALSSAPDPELTLSPSPALTMPKTLAPVKPPTPQPTTPPTPQPMAPTTPTPVPPPTPQPVQPPTQTPPPIPPLPILIPPPPLPLPSVPVPGAQDTLP